MNGDALKLIARALRVPTKDEDPTSWRLVVVSLIVVIGAVLALHLAASKGMLSTFGVNAVANAAEVAENKAVGVAILRRLTYPEIRRKVREMCRAETSAERDELERELELILTEFEAISGEKWGKLPTCNDV